MRPIDVALALRKKRATSGPVWLTQNLPASGFTRDQSPGLGFPFILFRQNTRKRTFLRNLLTITRNPDVVNEDPRESSKFCNGPLHLAKREAIS